MAGPRWRPIGDAGEIAFLDRLLDVGESNPSGLAVGDEVKARITAMPMLAWKAQNIRAYKAKGCP